MMLWPVFHENEEAFFAPLRALFAFDSSSVTIPLCGKKSGVVIAE